MSDRRRRPHRVSTFAAPFLILFGINSVGAATTASGSPPAAEPTAAAVVTELDALLGHLESDSIEVRRSAVRSIIELGEPGVSTIKDRLHSARKSVDPDLPPYLFHIEKRAPGVNLLDAVTNEPTDGHSTSSLARTTVTLLYALQRIGTTPAVRALVGFYPDFGGAFRLEITRLVRELGERAVPALIMARKDGAQDTRRFAFNQLESLGKRVPGEAVQTANNQVLADVLHAYGATHDMEALGVVLSFVNSDRAQVRLAARECVAGFGGDAIWKLREAYGNLVGHPPPDSWAADRLSSELFSTYDRYRLQEVNALVDEGLARHATGDLNGAVTALDQALARQPLLDRRYEMVAPYVLYAKAIEHEKPQQALEVYRKALRLDPEGHRSRQIQSAISTLESEALLERGVADVSLLELALRDDPANTKARSLLDRLEADEANSRSHRIRLLSAGTLLLAGVTLVVLFGGRRGLPQPKRH